MVIDNYRTVIENIKKHCDMNHINFNKITVLPISKTASSSDILQLINHGVTSFGESRLQDTLKKLDEIKLSTDTALDIQFIGRLQHNKLKKIINTFSLIHSVDSLETLQLINQISISKKPILIQINLAKEDQKAGVYEDELEIILSHIHEMSNIIFKGFMLIPPLENDHEFNRKYFKKARELFDKYSKIYASIDTLSMGMSDDYLIALEEGSTLLRIGSAIFSSK